MAQEVMIEVREGVAVSGLLQNPPRAAACVVLAHGAGAGMRHAFMADFAGALAALSIATLRYQFPYMERKSRRPDPPALCHATVAAAVKSAGTLIPGLPVVAGGKSFGGRMTSQAQAAGPLAGVRGIFFLGFPLHPPGEPSTARAKHLFEVHVPMLFLQGSRDAFAESALLMPVVEKLGAAATLSFFEDADHSFHVPARRGGDDARMLARAADALAVWTFSLSRGCSGNPSAGK